MPAAELALNGLSRTSLLVLASAGTVALVALYLVGRGRRRILVPFLSLWVPALPDRLLWAWARRLRRALSLLLQLAILACVLMAAGDPTFTRGTPTDRNVVFLLDRSASMGALDEPGTRMERARGIARAAIDGLGANDRARVVSFASGAFAVGDWETDRARLKTTVDTIAVSEEPGRLGDALIFAAGLLGTLPHPRIIVIGDGGGGGMADDLVVEDSVAAMLSGIDVRFAPVGRRSDNLGIVAFSARRLPADPTSVELVAAVQNFRGAPADVHLAVASGRDGVILSRRAIRLEPGARHVAVLKEIGPGEGHFEARLEGNRDDLPLDDRAYAVVAALPRLSVLVAGVRNLYLDGALLGMGDQVRVERVAGDALVPSRERWDSFDAVIFDGVSPHPLPEAGRFLFLNPDGADSPWPARGQIGDPVVTEVARDHPLLKQISLTDLNVVSARRLTLGAGDRAVVKASGVPLVIARERPGLRQVAVAFDVRRSDLPLRSAFPLLIANTLSWLSQREPPPALSLPTGTAVSLPVAARRGGQDVPLRGYVERSGIITLSEGATPAALEAKVAVNLASMSESDLAPRRSLRVGTRVAASPELIPPVADDRRRWGQVALVTALLLLSLEWLTFHRRMTV